MFKNNIKEIIMGLELKAEEKSILALFTGDKNQYIIPPYQRPYSWSEEQCRELFEDIKRAFDDENTNEYFLGNIVTASSREDKNRLEVIDGQQRLTTLTLLIRALLFLDKDNKKLANSIWELNRRTGEKQEVRLKTMVFQDKDSKFLQEALELDLSSESCKTTKKDNLFKKNICYFYKELEQLDEDELFDFSDFLLDEVSILPIQTQGNDKEIARENALKIFETINDRGLPLSDSDIFKAKLFSMALSESQSELFIDRWKTLDDECQNIKYKIDDIFRFYMHIIRAKQGMTKSEIGLREFYRQDYSPFNSKDDKYSDILDDLFNIIESIKFFKNISKDSTQNQELTKWFQLIELYSNQYPINTLFVYIYANGLEINDKLINFSRELVKYIYYEGATTKIKFSLFEINSSIIKNELKGFTSHKEVKESDFDYFGQLKKGFALLSLYLNPNQKAIYPYYINRIINSRDKKSLNSSWDEYNYTDYVDTIGNMLVLDYDISRDVILSNKLKYIRKSKILETRKLYEKVKDWSYSDYQERNSLLQLRLKSFFEHSNED